MNIFVCVKQVPDTETKIQLKEDNSGIKQDSIKWILNPYDEFAIEEALKLKKEIGADKVHAITLGPSKRVTETLRIALAMGADEGHIVNFDGDLDVPSTASAISKVVEKVGDNSLILTGKTAIDDNSSAFPQQLASFLNIPHCNGVTKVTAQDGKFEVEREIEGGSKEFFEISGAFVLGANKGLNTPRYPSLPGIMKAKKKPVTEYQLSELGVDSGNVGLKFVDYQLPPEKPPTKILAGDLSDQVSELVNLLKNEAKVL